jgi:pSer/pThr/pTyr-binding forkhead associated (FHA) protein
MRVKLLVVHGRPQGKSLVFPQGEFVFGRGLECHIRPNSDWVSRQHCLLRVTDEGAHLRDLGSRNGTLVNGTRVTGERRLEHGDKLQVGPLVFQIELDELSSLTAAVTPSASTLPDTRELHSLPAKIDDRACSETAEMRVMEETSLAGANQPVDRP